MLRIAVTAPLTALCIVVPILSNHSTAQAGSCPPDTILGKEFLTPSAIYEPYSPIAPQSGSYQLPAGTLSAHTASVVDFVNTVVIARDEYTLTGVPGGTLVDFDLVLDVTATVSNIAIFGAAAKREGGTVASFSGSSSRSGTAVLHLSETANQPFVIRYSIYQGIGSIGTFSEVESHASYRFANLPPGAHVASCQGYAQDADPAVAATWGAVKATYR
jgi:uncharacterized membrane protein